MLQIQTLAPTTFQLLKRLMHDEQLRSFRLVLSSHYSLNQMLDFYERKYNANVLMPLKAIIFFDEINFNEPVHLTNGKPVNWKIYEKRIYDMEKQPMRRFPE